jgi:hypothetical protein
MSIAASSQTRQRPEFVTLIAIYQFVTAGILLLMSCLIPAALFPFVVFNVDQTEGVFAGIVLGSIALALLLGFGFASIIVGWGLLRMREWARLGAIVLAAFALVGFPIWTIVAILVLVYMTSEEARFAFHPEEAPPEISARTVSTADPDAPTEAAYKAEPPRWTHPSPDEETRRAYYRPADAATNGAPHDTPPPDETRRIDTPIPMPPPEDPSAATEALYDQEADVSDHYRRWKASLPKEPTGDDELASEETDEPTQQDVDEPTAGNSDDNRRRESEADQPVDRHEESSTTEPGEEPPAQSPNSPTSSNPLSPEEAEELERIWGPPPVLQDTPAGDQEPSDQEEDVADREHRQAATPGEQSSEVDSTSPADSEEDQPEDSERRQN